MLRFRPIAPKPAADGSVTGTKPQGNKTEPVSKRRRKRKYVRVKKNKELCNNSIENEEKRDGSCLQFGDHGSVITLQLLDPESSSSVTTPPDIFAVNSPNLLDRKAEMLTMKESEHSTQNFKIIDEVGQKVVNPFENAYRTDEVQVYPPTRTTRTSESSVMVEGMTKSFVDGESLGSADMEKVKNVEMLMMVKDFEHPTQNFKEMNRVGSGCCSEADCKRGEIGHITINHFESPYYTTDKGQVYPLAQTTRTPESSMMVEGMEKTLVDGDHALGSANMEKMKNAQMRMMKEYEHPTQNFKKMDRVNHDSINSFENPYTQVYPLTHTVRTLESWVMVEGLTKAFVNGEDLEIKMKNVEMDTCPWLISDGLDRVQWVNLAYQRMVDPPEDGGPTPEIVVRLIVKEKITHMRSLQCNGESSNSAFACTVRVVYIWRNSKYSQIMPCDVWKIGFGGFAWRLDTKAALSLGR
ncbi:hypothetical protein K7X08_026894 [Anisodus acutangulus]|uniref:DUF7950 domain-containing protein n=1 Tax=Anisodus acutangulus TaxID=402998 RepID=A0A9Q1QWC7_9SOLA|nr:hypothetical protein K7X08_026894 [Anisodus acutangulus]